MSKIADIFNCQRCGYCCQGETTVSLNAEDQVRMINHLGLPREEIALRYWRQTGNTVQMKTIDGHCIFYAKGCTIHKGKPWRCSQWPLHPSMLSSRENFMIIRESCPGLNQKMCYEEFCEKFSQILKSSEKNKE